MAYQPYRGFSNLSLSNNVSRCNLFLSALSSSTLLHHRQQHRQDHILGASQIPATWARITDESAYRGIQGALSTPAPPVLPVTIRVMWTQVYRAVPQFLHLLRNNHRSIRDIWQNFPGGPVIKTPSFHCRRFRLDPWLGNYNPACHVAWPKNKRKKKSIWRMQY